MKMYVCQISSLMMLEWPLNTSKYIALLGLYFDPIHYLKRGRWLSIKNNYKLISWGNWGYWTRCCPYILKVIRLLIKVTIKREVGAIVYTEKCPDFVYWSLSGVLNTSYSYYSSKQNSGPHSRSWSKGWMLYSSFPLTQKMPNWTLKERFWCSAEHSWILRRRRGWVLKVLRRPQVRLSSRRLLSWRLWATWLGFLLAAGHVAQAGPHHHHHHQPHFSTSSFRRQQGQTELPSHTVDYQQT